MIFTVTALFTIAAFICTIAEALGKCPGWVVDALIVVVLMLMVFPK